MEESLTQEHKKKLDETARMLSIVMGGMGSLLMLFGLLCLLDMPMVFATTGIDGPTLTIIAWALIVVGILDITIVRFFMIKNKAGRY